MSITISSPVEFEFLTTDNFISPAIPFGTLNMGSFDAKWSGTFNGTVYIEGTDSIFVVVAVADQDRNGVCI